MPAITHHSPDQVLPFRASFMAVLGISFVVMLVSLDQAIVSTALPAMVADLHGFNLYAWVANAYLLTSIVSVPVCGRLGDYYGRKPFVIGAIVIFTLASLLCAIADSMLFLVLARALQGAGGGMLLGTAYACIPDLFPNPLTRMRWQVMISSAIGVASAAGPTLGGYLTESYGWRSMFYVNLPIGILSLVLVWRYLPHLNKRKPDQKVRIDWAGAALIALGLGALQVSVEMLLHGGWTGNAVLLLGISVLALACLWWWEGRCSHPIIPVEMFRDPGLGPLFVLALFAGFMMFPLLIYIPLLFQGAFQMGPRDAGIILTPLVVGIPIGSLINGRIVTRLRSPRRMLYLGFGMLTVATVGVLLTTHATSHAQLLFLMAAGGLGLGFINPNLVVFTQVLAARPSLGIATAMTQSLRMVGSMVGTALVGSLVRYHYGASVGPALADPQILVDKQLEAAVLAQLQAGGHGGAALVAQARAALAGSIQLGLLMVALAGVLALWRVRKVAFIPFKARAG